MPSFDVKAAQAEALAFCKSVTPRTGAQIALHLKKRLPDFYPGSPHEKVVGLMKASVLQPLVENGLVVEYSRQDGAWPDARKAANLVLAGEDKPRPRNVAVLYQANFLAFGPDPPERLPVMGKDSNLWLAARLARFRKPQGYSWGLLNLLSCAKDRQMKNHLRLFLYSLPLGHGEIEQLEELLERGNELPQEATRSDLEKAKKFLVEITVVNTHNTN
jgi:hypothetical protein